MPDIKEFSFLAKNTKMEFILMGCDGVWEGSCDQGKSIVKFLSDSLNKINHFDLGAYAIQELF